MARSGIGIIGIPASARDKKEETVLFFDKTLNMWQFKEKCQNCQKKSSWEHPSADFPASLRSLIHMLGGAVHATPHPLPQVGHASGVFARTYPAGQITKITISFTKHSYLDHFFPQDSEKNIHFAKTVKNDNKQRLKKWRHQLYMASRQFHSQKWRYCFGIFLSLLLVYSFITYVLDYRIESKFWML